jgi:hypothetical protein
MRKVRKTFQDSPRAGKKTGLTETGRKRALPELVGG